MFQVVQTGISGWSLSYRLNNNRKKQNKVVEVALLARLKTPTLFPVESASCFHATDPEMG